MSNNNLSPIVLDFEELLRYVGENKIVVTPKQGCIPLRHIKAMMEKFQVEEVHEEVVGKKIFKKRHELEYPRFYFLDLLALSGGFIKLGRKDVISKAICWKTFFSTHPSERGFLIFCAFRYNFDFDNWLHRGGDFGEQVCRHSERIWTYLDSWRSGQKIDWNDWAESVIKSCKLEWRCLDQTFAEGLATWALECCFVRPLEYFGLIETDRTHGEFEKLKYIWLNDLGRAYFDRISEPPQNFDSYLSPFSMN